MTTREAANRWLAEFYKKEHDARFAVAAAEEGSAFIPFVGELYHILCIEQERIAGLDNTASRRQGSPRRAQGRLGEGQGPARRALLAVRQKRMLKRSM